MIIVKIYLGISLELLWAMWGSVQFQIVPCSSLYFFSRSYRPLPVLQFSSVTVISDSATPWTAAQQAFLSIANSRSY